MFKKYDWIIIEIIIQLILKYVIFIKDSCTNYLQNTIVTYANSLFTSL